MGEMNTSADNFKVLVRNVVSRVMDLIPATLLDKELGMQAVPDQSKEIPADSQQADNTKQDAYLMADQAGHDGEFEEDEEWRLRLPLFTNKVMIFVQDLLKYKVSEAQALAVCLL